MAKKTYVTMPDVILYSKGVFHTSVCALKTLDKQKILDAADDKYPTGLDHGWSFSTEPFKDGTENPCQCHDFEDRLHYLLVC